MVKKPAVKTPAQLATHVFGAEDGAAIAKLFAKGLRVLSQDCTECNVQADPKKPFQWAMVALVTPRNSINSDKVYFVQLVDLHGERSVTFDLGRDNGASRVSNFLMIFNFKLGNHYLLNNVCTFKSYYCQSVFDAKDMHTQNW